MNLTLWYTPLLACFIMGKATVVGSAAPSSMMLPGQYPATPDSAACRSPDNARICDPDRILNDQWIQSLSVKLNDTKDRAVKLPKKCSIEQSSSGDDVVLAVQYGVALLRKMDFETKLAENEDALDLFAEIPEKAAEVFGRHVHDEWGVGLSSPLCGGTGVLIFLSIEDRSIFISRGAAVERTLTDRRLDQVVANMRPLLRESRFHEAISQAIDQLDQWLVKGAPSRKEGIVEFITETAGAFIFIVLWVSLGVYGATKEWKKRRDYAKVTSRLNEIDRARAEALQGKFNARSCPICLEDFQHSDEGPTGGEINSNEISSNNLKGSDGLPLKLLRCGHVFDQTCWDEWVSGNRLKANKCPICKQDVSGIEPQSRNLSSNREESNSERDGLLRPEDGRNRLGQEEQQARALQRYTQERNFRLLRLCARYPDYIQPHQVERWTRAGYNGQLARERTFLDSNPANARAPAGTHSSGGFGSGFGGGSSSGGRGSSW